MDAVNAALGMVLMSRGPILSYLCIWTFEFAGFGKRNKMWKKDFLFRKAS
jgi:hypothetical protein